LQVGYSRIADGEGVTAVESFIMIVSILMVAPTLHVIAQLARVMTSHYSAHVSDRADMLALMKLKNIPEALQKDSSDYYSHGWEVLQVVAFCEKFEGVFVLFLSVFVLFLSVFVLFLTVFVFLVCFF
jgi:hypothetical protein